MNSKHKSIREGDEYACSCGLRWGVNEFDPHEPEYRRLSDGRIKNCRTGEVTGDTRYRPR